MTLHRVVLEIEADVNDDGTQESAEFHMVGNVTVSEQTQIDYALSNRGQEINSAISRLLGDPDLRKGFYFDIGEGTHTIEVQFNGWEGATDSNDNNVPWGDTSEPSPSVANATGADPLTQMQVFHRYLLKGVVDSVSPARLRLGEYDADNGLAGFPDYMDVIPLNPRGSHAAEDFSSFDGAFQFVEVQRLDAPIDIKEKLPY